jgi:hypothetical protein
VHKGDNDDENNNNKLKFILEQTMKAHRGAQV